MSPLGEILCAKGWLTGDDLQAALERQRQLGGKLGTCLLELGSISEDLLLETLGEQLATPVATPADLRDIPSEVTSLLPAKFAIRAQAVPFRAGGSRVAVAMRDVGNLTLADEITFFVGKRVEFHIATELRIAEALGSYYGHSPSPRLVGLAQRLSSGELSPKLRRHSRLRSTPKERETPAASPPKAQESELASAQTVQPKLESIHLTAEEQAMLAEVRQGAPRSQPNANSEALFIERLALAETSKEIGVAMLDVLALDFARILLFRAAASAGEYVGWLAHGPEIDSDFFASYRVAIDESTVFNHVQSTGEPFFGKLDVHPEHQSLARCWGGSLDHECIVLPLFVRGHLVCIVYADRKPLGLERKDLETVRQRGERAALAFERCILRRKLATNS